MRRCRTTGDYGTDGEQKNMGDDGATNSSARRPGRLCCRSRRARYPIPPVQKERGGRGQPAARFILRGKPAALTRRGPRAHSEVERPWLGPGGMTRRCGWVAD